MSLQIKGVRTENGDEITIKDGRNSAAGRYLINFRNHKGDPIGGVDLSKQDLYALAEQLVAFLQDDPAPVPRPAPATNTSLDHSTQLHAELAANPFVK